LRFSWKPAGIFKLFKAWIGIMLYPILIHRARWGQKGVGGNYYCKDSFPNQGSEEKEIPATVVISMSADYHLYLKRMKAYA